MYCYIHKHWILAILQSDSPTMVGFYCTPKNEKIFQANENRLEQCFAAHIVIVQCCQQHCSANVEPTESARNQV